MLRERKKWNINNFNQVNLPELVGNVDPQKFSEFNRIRVLDLPLFMPNQGWKIPENIQNQFGDMIKKVSDHEQQFGDFEKNHYVYITVDQKIVQCGKTGRRAGAHSDAYIEQANQQLDITTENAEYISNEIGEVTHTYITTDCFPTEFFLSCFPLVKTSCDESLKTFDEIAEKSPIVTYPLYTILRLDPFMVHRCAIATETRERTFVKISISKKRYARKGNTINPQFVYDWDMKARSPENRNHPW